MSLMLQRVVLSFLRRTAAFRKLYVDFNEVVADVKGAWSEILPNYKNNWTLFFDKLKIIPAEDLALRIQFYPGGRELWNGLKEYSPEILSGTKEGAPSWYVDKSQKVKELWVRKNLGSGNIVRQTLSNDKSAHAMTGDISNILIDDSPDKIQQWESAGGIGILHKGNAKATIDKIREIMAM